MFVAAVVAAAAVSFFSGNVGAATPDKELSRVKGIVAYGNSPTGNLTKTFGSVELSDNQFAVTQAKSLAELKLRDSSVIEIGPNTSVQVGAFNAANTADKKTITVNVGSVHFVIRHPEGQQANYQFTTPTSQIAVRGTEGLITVTSNSTQVSLASGTVTVTTGTSVVTVTAGQSVTVVGTTAANATVGSTSVARSTASTTTTSAVGGSSLGTVAGAAAGAGAVGAVAASSSNNSNNNSSASPAPGQPGPIVVTGTGTTNNTANGSTGTTIAGSLPFTGNSQNSNNITVTQTNCTGPISVAITPAGSASVSPSSFPCVDGNVNSAASVTFNQYGTVQFALSGSGQTYTHTENVFGYTTIAVNNTNIAITEANPGTISTNGAGNYGLTISEAGPSAPLTATLSCPGTSAPNYQPGAASPGIGLNTPGNFSATGTSSLALTLVVVAGPTYPTGTAPTSAGPPCQLTATGAGGDQVTAQISVTTTGLTIQGGVRRPEIVPGGRKPR
jgi:hypothetical protein